MSSLSDGVFAVTMVALGLGLAVPAIDEDELLWALAEEWSSYVAYLVSFVTLGATWIGHSTLTNSSSEDPSRLARLNLLLLFVIGLLPFSTRILSESIATGADEWVAATLYGLLLWAIALVLLVLWRVAFRGNTRDSELSGTRSSLGRPLGLSVLCYPLLIVAGIFAPWVAIVGYLIIGTSLLIPYRRLKSRRAARAIN
ncbi:TMEM175 family protein [Microbacterium sp. KCTC 39802]|uniref:TMEM175 family protein n=1 Tax=Microbacterium ureisolvens TaxID=2781186 RepID=UPI000D65794C